MPSRKRLTFDDDDCQTIIRHVLEELEKDASKPVATTWGVLATDKCPTLPYLRPLREAMEEDLEAVSTGLANDVRDGSRLDEDRRRSIEDLVDRYKPVILKDLRKSLNWDTWLRYKAKSAYENHVGAADVLISGSLVGAGTLALGFGRSQAVFAAATAAFASVTRLPKRLRDLFSRQ
jgi:hypothetical protein